MSNELIHLTKKVFDLRCTQVVINEVYKGNAFKGPTHLAMGHEAIAAAVSACKKPGDRLLLSHRNIHYNFFSSPTRKALLDEYQLKDTGLGGGRCGSMNLVNPPAGIVYTSSILGNNLCVATGVALGERIKQTGALTFVVTGDGAMEEGSFYESLVLMNSTASACVVIVENNGWSLASTIEERRYPLDVMNLTKSLDVEYLLLEGNNVVDYAKKLKAMCERAIETKSPVVVEVKLRTLGHWILTNDEHPQGKFINYHAGRAPSVFLEEAKKANFILEDADTDPLYVMKQEFSEAQWNQLCDEVYNEVMEEGLL